MVTSYIGIGLYNNWFAGPDIRLKDQTQKLVFVTNDFAMRINGLY
jgi:hypothetical protein